MAFTVSLYVLLLAAIFTGNIIVIWYSKITFPTAIADVTLHNFLI